MELNPLYVQPMYYAVIVVGIDTLLGIINAIKNNNFVLRYISNFLLTNVIGQLLPLGILAAACHLEVEGIEAVRVLYAGAVVAFAGSTLDSLGEKLSVLFGIAKSPTTVRKIVKEKRRTPVYPRM
jgi:hypothetical protein